MLFNEIVILKFIYSWIIIGNSNSNSVNNILYVHVFGKLASISVDFAENCHQENLHLKIKNV